MISANNLAPEQLPLLMAFAWPAVSGLPVSTAAALRPVLGVSPDDLVPLIGGKGRAKQAWEVLRRGDDPLAEDSGLGNKARAALLSSVKPVGDDYTISRTTVSSCGTRKLLVELARGEAVETVIIPTDQTFSTLCESVSKLFLMLELLGLGHAPGVLQICCTESHVCGIIEGRPHKNDNPPRCVPLTMQEWRRYI